MVNLWRLLTLGLLAMFPLALYNFWIRHSDWTRSQKLYKTFALLTSASVLVVFGDTVGIRLARLLEVGFIGVGLVSLVLWAWFGAEVRRNQAA
jgi:hypothetical protein